MNPATDITLTQMSLCLKISLQRFLLIAGGRPSAGGSGSGDRGRFPARVREAGQMMGQVMETIEAVEGFAVETLEGLIFTVKGLVHPPHRSIAYLRFMPDPEGDRKRGGVVYRRVYRFEEQREILQRRFPIYIAYDPIFGFEVQGVPGQYMQRIYNPCLRLAEILEKGAKDPLEENSLAFANLLKDAAGVPMSSLGVSGSVLVGLHRPGSDVDLAVYGDRESRGVHGALGGLLDSGQGPVRRLDRAELAALHASHRIDTPLTFSDFVRLQSRKTNEGYFAGIPYFIRFIKGKREGEQRYGDTSYEPLGKATIRFRVTDDGDAIFTPCRYSVEEVLFLDRAGEADLREVVSFRGRFSDQVRTGEPATARGSLERVVPREGKVHHRLAVGGEAGDYLLSRGQPISK